MLDTFVVESALILVHSVEVENRIEALFWLRYDDEVYYITGKPGSGKSILMQVALS